MRTTFTLIGTTDRDYHGDPAAARASGEEIAYLCTAVTAYFAKPVAPGDVVWTYSGVRPLYDDGTSDAQAATRDYVFDIDAPEGGAPVFSIFGGKITTYRRLAEAALDRLKPYIPGLDRNEGWTAKAPLPGGDFPVDGRGALIEALRADFPFLSPRHAARLAGAYGTRARRILEGARRLEDLGRNFGADLTEAELRYLMEEEWAGSAEDVVWRRSKLGLVLSSDEIAALDRYMVERAASFSTEKVRR